MNNADKLIDDIIRLRKEKKVTQQQLSDMTGIKQPVIARLERKKTDPHLSTIIRILDCLESRLIIDDKYKEED